MERRDDGKSWIVGEPCMAICHIYIAIYIDLHTSLYILHLTLDTHITLHTPLYVDDAGQKHDAKALNE